MSVIPFSFPQRSTDDPVLLGELAPMLLDVLRTSGDRFYIDPNAEPHSREFDLGVHRVDLCMAGWDVCHADLCDAIAWAQRILELERLGHVFEPTTLSA